MGEQLEARKDEALTAVEEAIYGALKRADLLREVGPFLRQILALEALGAVLSVVRAESGQPSSVPSSPHETGGQHYMSVEPTPEGWCVLCSSDDCEHSVEGRLSPSAEKGENDG